jgi:uncharacterized membrane protein YraQ (UPF0718 family)
VELRVNNREHDKKIYEMFEIVFRAAKFIFGGAFVSMMIAVLVPEPFGQYLGSLIFFSVGLYWFMTCDRVSK